MSMPDYVIKALQNLEYPASHKPQHSPHKWVPKTYIQKAHLAPSEDTSSALSAKEIRHIQRIVGSFLYYTRAVDSTVHTAVNDLGSSQSKPTKKTNDESIMLIDYLYTHPNKKLDIMQVICNYISIQMQLI